MGRRRGAGGGGAGGGGMTLVTHTRLITGPLHPWRGGGTQVLNGYLLPFVWAEWKRSMPNLGAVTSFESNKEGRSTSNTNLIRVVTWKKCLFSLYFAKCMILHGMLCGRIPVTFAYNFALRKYDYRGRWYATLYRWKKGVVKEN